MSRHNEEDLSLFLSSTKIIIIKIKLKKKKSNERISDLNPEQDYLVHLQIAPGAISFTVCDRIRGCTIVLYIEEKNGDCSFFLNRSEWTPF